MAVRLGRLVGIDLPRLVGDETIRLRLRVRAIQNARPMVYRAKVLGRALLAASTDANKILDAFIWEYRCCLSVDDWLRHRQWREKQIYFYYCSIPSVLSTT